MDIIWIPQPDRDPRLVELDALAEQAYFPLYDILEDYYSSPERKYLFEERPTKSLLQYTRACMYTPHIRADYYPDEGQMEITRFISDCKSKVEIGVDPDGYIPGSIIIRDPETLIIQILSGIELGVPMEKLVERYGRYWVSLLSLPRDVFEEYLYSGFGNWEDDEDDDGEDIYGPDDDDLFLDA